MNRVTLTQQVTDLDTLAKFVELMQDPTAIKKAHEEARSQLKLTDEEQEKYDSAKGLVANQEKLAGELKDRQDILTESQIKNEATIADIDSRMKELGDATLNLKNDMQNHATNVERLKVDRDRLATETESTANLKNSLESKANQLAELEASLNVRAERILAREKALEIREKANPL